MRCRNRVGCRQAEAHTFAKAKREILLKSVGVVYPGNPAKSHFFIVGIMCMRVNVVAGVITFYVFLLLSRSEIKLWSPLSSEGGKTHPYKMNLESEPKVCVCVCFFCSIFQMVGISILSLQFLKGYTHFPSHPQ